MRRNGDALDVLVLCDSPVVVLDTAGQIHEIRDDRLNDAIARIRPRGDLQNLPAQQRAALIAEFESHRNQPDGFWCVTATPEAAQHSLIDTFAIEDVDLALTMTDGVAVGVIEYCTPQSWKAALTIAAEDPCSLVDIVHDAEAGDPDCSQWPRSKRHDDKAAAIVIPVMNR